MRIRYAIPALTLAVALIVLSWGTDTLDDGQFAVQGSLNGQAVESPNADIVDVPIVDVPEAEPAVSEPSAGPADETQAAQEQAVPIAVGGGSILAERRLVTYYGHPFDERMGILGELDQETLVARLRRAAALYEAAGSSRPVQPAIHFIATVAQEHAGSDGMYRARTPASVIEEYSRLAAENGMLLILDVQVGRSTVQEEVSALLPFLEQPHVHLALDPEFDMWADQLPGIQLGHMSAAEVNWTSNLLADIVARNRLPNKVLILHQYTASMLPDKQLIETRPGVDLVVVMDGFGGRGIKLRHYEWYVHDELIQYGGIKMFFRQDVDLLEPADVLALDPSPDVMVYQ
ncbi:MAG: hypothetical protein HY675_06500 [Chloroflexi bacterium]|nr:hypothetical protein [Chloroflexota bacterium]